VSAPGSPPPESAISAQVTAADGSIWITSGSGGAGVSRIDPSTDRVAAVIPVGGPALGIAASADRIWVTRTSGTNGHVLRIDPRTNRVAGPAIAVGPGPNQLAYVVGSMWVQDSSPLGVMRIDPATGRTTTPIVLANALKYSFPGAIATGYGSLWVTAGGELLRFNPDPATGRIASTLPIPRANAIATGAGSTWVLAEPRSTSPTIFHPIRHTAALWQVDPRTNRRAGAPVRLDAMEPIALVVAGNRVWVGDYPDTIIELRVRAPP
jgi:hypothetical protein